MQLNRVVFPAPLGPTSPTLSPRSTMSVTSETAVMPPKPLETPRTLSRGRGSPRSLGPLTSRRGRGPPRVTSPPVPGSATATTAVVRRHGRGAPVRPVASGSGRTRLAEEEPLEALGRPTLLVLEHALGVLGVGEGPEGEQDEHQALTAEAARQIRHQLERDGEPDPGLDRPLHRADPGGDDHDDEDQREADVEVVGSDTGLVVGEEGAPDAGHRPREGEDQDPLPGEVDPQPGRPGLA